MKPQLFCLLEDTRTRNRILQAEFAPSTKPKPSQSLSILGRSQTAVRCLVALNADHIIPWRKAFDAGLVRRPGSGGQDTDPLVWISAEPLPLIASAAFPSSIDTPFRPSNNASITRDRSD